MTSADAETLEHKLARSHRPKVAKDDLGVLLQILGTSDEPATQLNRCDAILIAIDFEITHNFDANLARSSDTQVGPILDTRDISASTPQEQLISTHNFVTGSPEYYRKAQLVSFWEPCYHKPKL